MSSPGLAAEPTSSRPSELGLTPRRFLLVVGPCAVFLLGVLLVTPWLGSTGISWQRVVEGLYPDREIFVFARWPRIWFGALAGGSLAVAGVLFQAILRNALATPFTLGISSGSNFGAILAIWLGWEVVILGIPVVSVAAFAGAILTMMLVFAIARTRDTLPTFTLLLAGVTLNFMFAALILFLHYLSPFTESFLMVRWMMGNVGNVSYSILLKTTPLVIGSVIVLLRYAPKLNLIAAGEQWATTLGVDVRAVKTMTYVLGSLLTGLVTAFAGPIGFVGLIVPHALRMVAGPDHRVLIPGAFFLGGGFLVVCDTAARMILAPIELPVGVITALAGGPVFVLLLKRKGSGLS